MKKLFCFLVLVLTYRITVCIPEGKFYPFGSSTHDHDFPKNDDGSSPRVHISTLFPFFNSQHNSLFVNTNGAISFQATLSQFTPAPFPLNDQRSIVSPFWADVDIRNGGTVWYRETTDGAILRRATADIQLYYPDQVNFHASWVFIATWDDVAFFGASATGQTKRNTFQAVLITNGRHSFTIFNYAEITWTTGTASEGNANTGLGGTPAQVGFNGGDGANYYALDESRTSAIINLAHMSNVKVNGTFVFRIDTATIEKGGYNTGGTMVIYPRHIAMFGSQEVIVSGPCIAEKDTTSMIFPGNQTQPCLRRSEFSVACLTPTTYANGDIDVSLAIANSDGHTSLYQGFCTVVNPLSTEPGLVRVYVGDWAREKNVTVQWDPVTLPFTAGQADIDIYTIEPTNDHQPRLIFEKKVAVGVYINQSRTSFLFNVETNVVVLKMTEVGHINTLRHSTWSDAFVVKPNLQTNQGQTEARDTCMRQLTYDDTLPPLSALNIQPCPCRAEQIEVDIARFHPDPLCQDVSYLHGDFKTSRNCQQAEEAFQCYRLNTPGPSNTGHLCCYDFHGNLMDAKSQAGGGTENRYHYRGGPGNVPYLSTLMFDTSPYFHCCKYVRDSAGSAMCARLLGRRPQGDCRTYQPVRSGRLSGDPHLTTLDGLPYTFNGVGEFTLLKHINNTFFSQVRTEQIAGSDGVLRKASVITSFSAKTMNVSDTVEIQLNSIRVADVLINGEIVDFSHYRSLHFKGVTTTMSERNSTDGSAKQFNVLFSEPSIAFRILAYPSLLNVIVVSGSDALHGNIIGLLGNYNGDRDDDLVSADGLTLSPNATARDIHQRFGLTWRVTKDDSLFTYPIGKNYTTYQNVAFTPIFPAVNQTYPKAAVEVCGNDTFCLYDYLTTGRTDIAASTKAATQIFEVMQRQAEPIHACGPPVTVDFGYWNNTGYILNSTATLECDKGKRPDLYDVISCTVDDEWENSNDTCIEIRCGALPDVHSGRWIQGDDTVGSNATLVCDTGTTLHGLDTITCDRDGAWEAVSPTCATINCGTLPTLDHGQWVSNCTTFGHSAELVCEEGRKPTEEANVTCGRSGNWTIGTQACDLVNCGTLPTLQHGQWVSNGTTFGHTAQLVCDEGRKPTGVANVTCGLSGNWPSGTQSCDLVNCGMLPALDHGQWVSNGTTFGHTAVLVCEEGMKPSGEAHVKCGLSGNWSIGTQSCDMVNCGTLPTLQQGQWVSNGTTFGHTAELVCEEGRKPTGETNVMCGLSGNWTIGTQSCDLVNCGILSALKHGQWVGNGTTFGHTAELVCEEGRKPTGEAHVMCGLSGTWAISTQACDLVRRPTSSKAVICGVVGGLVSILLVLALAMIAGILYRKRRHKSVSLDSTAHYHNKIFTIA